jgi:2-polyprenyl-3-methyl-5-hydroxy-6-metoxy-1,4-benzoquinol methylase
MAAEALGNKQQDAPALNLAPEARLVLAAACADATPCSAQEMEEILAQPLDWGVVHRIAFRNAQVPFLDQLLQRHPAAPVPEDTRLALARFSAAMREHNEFVLRLLPEMHTRFSQAGIATMAYVETASSLVSPARADLRDCICLDLVIRPADLPGARQLLQQDGRWKEQQSPAFESRLTASAFSAWGEGPRDSAICLQFATLPRVRAIRLELQDLWARAVKVSVQGRDILCPCPEDLVLHLCAQNSEYLWFSLQGVADLAAVLRTCPDLRWDHLLPRAKQSGIERMVFLGLRLAERLFAARLPAAARTRMAQDSTVEPFAADIIHKLFQPAIESVRTPQMLSLHLRLRNRVADRARYLWRFATSPTEVDRQLLRLPARLHFLYPWLRPVRLAGAALRKTAWPVKTVLRSPESISGYSPSGSEVVNRMLELAEVRPGDVVFDLGCGDGRIVIAAAKRYGVRGVGIDLDPQRIRECHQNAEAAGVERLVEFRQADVMQVDCSAASIVMMYLPPKACLQLSARLLRELRPGARIVSHNADPGGWDKVEACAGSRYPSLLYVRKVPERARAAAQR